ncbi:vWA domain-containing protein [Hyphomicrobium sp.]|jgi:mxaC protein|uniref:vWA domain-containing protein n=1 Tax=Hyphomicrobium sp. TaxID=82 RepID=UPI002BE612DA|nr:vWA domain-containing protein [Hyphomicrobium sp.]HVZ04851.1 vWA domain-containing protein [Hyphomicrobium sp.]
MIFTHPAALYLLPLALIPLFFNAYRQQAFPSFEGVEIDRLSLWVDRAVRLAGSLAITALIAGIAGIALRERTVERLGRGAHIVLLIDRSSSMDETFAGREPSGAEESKSSAAKRLLKEFVKERAHDQFGVAVFTTAPIRVLPVTDSKDAVLGSIDAIDRPALAYTDVGRGLAMALSIVDEDKSLASRAIVLVSDGAAVIARRVQESLRADFARRPLHLYWLYLRTKGSNGIFEPPPPGTEDTAQVLPERHLNLFFQSLHIPYKAFEAESPQAVESAIAEIGKLEQRPIVYPERIPQYDLSQWAYGIAAFALLLLLGAKLYERPLSPVSRSADA